MTHLTNVLDLKRNLIDSILVYLNEYDLTDIEFDNFINVIIAGEDVDYDNGASIYEIKRLSFNGKVFYENNMGSIDDIHITYLYTEELAIILDKLENKEYTIWEGDEDDDEVTPF